MTHTANESAQDLRKQVEEKVRDVETTPPEILSPEASNQLFHELRVHQIELEMQNEELRRTQHELEASRARYFDLYNLAPVGYLTLSEQGFIVEANLTSTNLLGATKGALVKQPLSHFILPEDQDCYYLHRQQLAETGWSLQECELRMVRADGSLFWVHLQAMSAQETDGTSECRIVMRDCTRQRLLEEEIRLSEEKFRTIADYTYNWEYWVSPEGDLLYNHHVKD